MVNLHLFYKIQPSLFKEFIGLWAYLDLQPLVRKIALRTLIKAPLTKVEYLNSLLVRCFQHNEC
jgi:hypothetical protein